MPAATTKADLIEVTEKDWAKLWTVLEPLTEAEAGYAAEGDYSVRDTVLHRAHWIDLFFQWWDEGQETGSAETPDHGVKWSELKPYNAGLRERYADVSWDEAKERLATSHARLLAFMKDTPEEALYGGPMIGGNGKWTAGRYAEASGPSHYRSALKYVRACLKTRS